jgi:formylglycine-generating enzyme required for sulfatase activity
MGAWDDTWTRPTDGMVMVHVPAGEFEMGNDNEGVRYARQLCNEYYKAHIARGICIWERFEDELPAHMVALDSFWIDRTEVTNGKYRRCVEAGACDPPARSGSHTRDRYYDDSTYGDYPVVYVDWYQAADYCAWAGGRLPTEAEWEYAARGSEGRLFPWGDAFDGTRLNYCDANCEFGYADEMVDDGYADTAPVGQFPAGASWCGGQDLAGNVREWVADWYGNYSSGRQVNPTGPSSGTGRVLRGGAWPDAPDDVRSVNRGGHKPDVVHEKVGFRCAWDEKQHSGE